MEPLVNDVTRALNVSFISIKQECKAAQQLMYSK